MTTCGHGMACCQKSNFLGEVSFFLVWCRGLKRKQWFVAIIQWELKIIKSTLPGVVTVHHTHLRACWIPFHSWGLSLDLPKAVRQTYLSQHDSSLKKWLSSWSVIKSPVLLFWVIYQSFMESPWWFEMQRSSSSPGRQVTFQGLFSWAHVETGLVIRTFLLSA